MLYRKIPKYSFENLDYTDIKNGEFLNVSFYISLPKLKRIYDNERTLFAVSDVFEIRVIKRSYCDDTADIGSIIREGCFYFNEENEWMLEVRAKMSFFDKSKTDTFILRLPLSLPSIEEMNVGIYYDGTWIRFLSNGEVLNENTGYECFDNCESEIFIDQLFKDIKVAIVKDVTLSYVVQKTDASPAFYFPYNWNTNVGDVMNFYHNGVYHLMYLLDRRHHGSRNGIGAHYICHITSENLIDWYEQEPIAQITKPWISYGTGTMLYQNGKYYMTYGLHTERFKNLSTKIAPEFNEESESFSRISFEEILNKGGLPVGASYSYSEDGLNFTPSNVLIHASRNPSVYNNGKNGITLYGGYGGEGVYESESFEEPFKKIASDFIKKSFMKNTSECPAFFDWNGYKYLIVGFTGYFRTLEKSSEDFVDVAVLGENIYDGLSVPMVAEFKNNRRIMAGWVQSPQGWGGVLLQRELVAEENGKLGIKWIPELMPSLNSENLLKSVNILEKGFFTDPFSDYLLDLYINPKGLKRLGVSFSDKNGACVLQLNIENNRIQINDAPLEGFGVELPTFLELLRTGSAELKNTPRYARNYALDEIKGINQEFTLKIIVRYSKRMHSTVIDAEIAGCRTLISVRPDFYPSVIKTLYDGKRDLISASIYSISHDE